MINEGGFSLDADGLPSGASGELFDDDGNPTARWNAERLPRRTRRPSLDKWTS